MQLTLSEVPRIAIRRVSAVINPASGSVGPGAADELARLLAERGLDHSVHELSGDNADRIVGDSLARDPDLVVVLGGDGTARCVAEACGPDGPLVAPLAGGTMNKLGRALYEAKPWRDALAEALENGAPRWVSGGEVGGRAFYCGAVIGSPALLARAREAIRDHELGRAWRQTVVATRKALRSRISYDLEGVAGRDVAISLLCPAVFPAPDAPQAALRAAVLESPDTDASATASLLKLLSNLLGDWRGDPDSSTPCTCGRAWAKTSMPVMLDGEFFRLGREVEIRFRPRAFRALALVV